MQISQTWVTQLQLEMLAAPAQSALLVSRSASQVRSKCYASGSQSGGKDRLYPCTVAEEAPIQSSFLAGTLLRSDEHDDWAGRVSIRAVKEHSVSFSRVIMLQVFLHCIC